MFNPDTVKVPRYAKAGVPTRAFVISNSERMELGCDRRWFFRYGARLQPQEDVRALRYGTAWAEWQEDIYRWWMVHDAPYPYSVVLGDGPGSAHEGSCPWCEDGVSFQSSPEGDVEVECRYCGGSGRSVPAQILDRWQSDEDSGRMDPGAAMEEAEVLWAAIVGYQETYGAGPLPDYKVVGVELEVAAPIMRPDGLPFRSRIPIFEEEDLYRVCRPGEAPSFWAVLPWYQVGKLDVVLMHRVTGVLWVQDAKSSRDPSGYLRNVTVDPQTTGYVWMLEHAIAAGLLPLVSHGRVGGVQFDVASSSAQRSPARLVDKEVPRTQVQMEERAIDEDLASRDEVRREIERLAELAKATKGKWNKTIEAAEVEALISAGELGKERARRRAAIVRWKPPAYSKASNVTTPSWLYRRALEQAAPTPDGQLPDISDYEEHMRFLRETVDPKLYQREPIVVSAAAIKEYALELFGVAQNLADKIRGLPEATPEGLPVIFPRTPLCRKPGGSCPYTALCAGGSGPEVLADFEVLGGLTWGKAAQ